MIRNILFDMGNVLIRFAPEVFVLRVGVSDEADRELLLREVYHSVEWVELDRGVITDAEAIAAMNARLPERLHQAVEKLVTHWDRPPLPVDGMEELAEALQSAGYGLYLLTNAALRHREYWPKFSVSRFFPPERIFLSADHKLLKPEREFYLLALERFGLRAEECVFIDDNPANAEGAVRAGIPAVVFHGSAPLLRETLRAMGVREV